MDIKKDKMEYKGESNCYRIPYRNLYEAWKEEREKENKQSSIYNCILNTIGGGDVSNIFINYLSEKSRNITKNFNSRWEKSHRKSEIFEKQNAEWLTNQVEIKNPELPLTNITNKGGRPRLSYSEKSDRAQRRDAAELSKENEFNVDLMLHAASTSARKRGLVDLAVVLKKTKEDPGTPSKIRKVLTNDEAKPIKFSDDEALALILENNLTKEQYYNIRKESKQRNCDIYPLYQNILASKLKCRPEGVTVTEGSAKVPLKKLLNHTIARTIELQREVVTKFMKTSQKSFLKCKFIFSYGFDGSTGHSNYKQKFLDPSTSQQSDSSLFATTLIPLRLTDDSGTVLWNNRTPQSVRFCRPLKLEFIKETKDNILEEKENLQKEIEELETFIIKVDDERSVEITCELFLTVIDGKVLKIITDTKSFQACPICGAKPKDFLNIKDFKSHKFKPIKENLKHGISPLHCWLRFFEFVLHLAYKLCIKAWQARGEKNKKLVAERKTAIQNLFLKELGLQVDKPKANGCGNTNDGNTARRAFNDHEKFSEITGVDKDIIYNLKIILICLSCQLPLNVESLELFCFQTAAMIIEKYPWCPMTATVHKVLIHSKQIIENMVLPIGYFGEDAAESRHKIFKNDRLHHARKNSRVNNLSDVFNRALDTSDPLLSSISLNKRIRKQKKIRFPQEVINLLCSEVQNQENVEGDDEDDDNDDDDDNGREYCRDSMNLNSDYKNFLDNLELENELDD